MVETDSLDRSMARAGALAGLASILSYFGAAFLPLPDAIARLLAFAIGPLFALGFLGLFHALRDVRDGPALRFGVAFGVMAGLAVTTMLVIQVGNNMTLGAQLGAEGSEAAKEAARQVHKAVDRVQYLIDVVWDIFGTVAAILVAWAMLRHPAFGRIWGGVGIVASLLLLYLNLDTFPRPPAAAGSIDAGPLVAIWLLAVFARAFWVNRATT